MPREISLVPLIPEQMKSAAQAIREGSTDRELLLYGYRMIQSQLEVEKEIHRRARKHKKIVVRRSTAELATLAFDILEGQEVSETDRNRVAAKLEEWADLAQEEK